MSARPRVHAALAALAVVSAIALGWLALRFPVALDVTANARHGLSESSRASVAALDGPVTITAVLGPDPGVRDAVEDLIARYRELAPDITLDFVNPDTDPARARALGAAPGGELILQAGGREQRLQRLDERTLTGALRKLARERTRELAFVSGHGERAVDSAANDDWGLIAERLAAIGIESRPLSFVTEPRVPASVDVLVIAAPRTAYFPGEVAGVLDHLRGGGNLLWLIETAGDSVGAADASPPLAAARAAGDAAREAAPSTAPNTAAMPLAELAEELGIRVLPGSVIDTASQALVADAPGFVVLNIHPDHPITRTLAQPVLLPQATALEVRERAGQQVAALLATPASSWTETGPLVGEVRFDEGGDEISGPLLLGAAIERERGTGREPQRIAVIGDADFGASRFLGNGANAALVESLVTWLAGDDEALEFVTTAAPDASLELADRTIVVLSVALLLGLPGALLLVALGVRVAVRRDG